MARHSKRRDQAVADMAGLEFAAIDDLPPAPTLKQWLGAAAEEWPVMVSAIRAFRLTPRQLHEMVAHDSSGAAATLDQLSRLTRRHQSIWETYRAAEARFLVALAREMAASRSARTGEDRR